MTRLDANSEPSMEEILASIRKIIAEDPPGSRASPAPASAAPRTSAEPTGLKVEARDEPSVEAKAEFRTEPGFGGRGSYFPTLSPPGSMTDTPEQSNSAQTISAQTISGREALPADPVLPRGPMFGADAVNAPFGKLDDKLQRTEPLLPSFAQSAARPDTGTDKPSASLSIDDQLSDLLADALPLQLAEDNRDGNRDGNKGLGAASHAAASNASSMTAGSGSKDNGAAIAGSPLGTGPAMAASPTLKASDAPRAPEGLVRDSGIGRDAGTGSGTGLVAKRDSGFIPGGLSASKEPSRPELSRLEPVQERDPFDFDLGPLPLMSKASAAKAETPLPSSPAAPSLGGIGGVKAMPETVGLGKADDLAGAKKDDPLSKRDANADPFAALTSAKPVAVPPASGSSASQSVATTSADTLAKPSAATSAMAAARSIASPPATEPPRADSGQAVPVRDVMDFASAMKSVGTAGHSVAGAKHEPSFASLGSSSASPVPPPVAPTASLSRGTLEAAPSNASLVTQAQAEQRSMEDTVAELLRPMLRDWLAENMPRIVERALLRELNSLPPPSSDRKTAAE